MTLPHTPYNYYPSLIYLVLLLLIGAFALWRDKKENGFFYFLLYPIIVMLGIFESLFMYLPFFNSHRYDALMAKIDDAMFGSNPTLWFDKIISPLLTDSLYLLYFFYFPMPFFLAIWLIKRKMFSALSHYIFIVFFTYFGAYLTFFFIPVHGPRFYLEHLHQIPLDGFILAKPIHTLIDFMEPNKLDAFPSLHTAILLVVMVFCAKYHRRMFLWFLPISAGILISLIYLRYHYVIDVIAGILWMIAAYFSGSVLYKKLSSLFAPHFPSAKDNLISMKKP